MKTQRYKPSKGFIFSLLLIIFLSWLVPKCVPLTKEAQDNAISRKMESQLRQAAIDFDTITEEELKRLPNFNRKKYFLVKRNNRYWLIPSKYTNGYGGVGDYGGAVIGFEIRWPSDVNELLNKNWKDNYKGGYKFGLWMHSPQYYERTTDYLGREIFSDSPCDKNSLYINAFRWNGVLIQRYTLGILQLDKNGKKRLVRPKLTKEQYLDICLTSLKILNEKIQEIHYVN